MPITVSWDNAEKTIIRYDITDPWTWAEFIAALEADDAMLNEVDHVVHLVFNAEHMRIVPPSPIARFREIANLASTKLGLVVLAGGSMWFQKLGELFYNVHGRRLEGIFEVRAAKNVAEARQIIAAHEHQRFSS